MLVVKVRFLILIVVFGLMLEIFMFLICVLLVDLNKLFLNVVIILLL